MLKRKNARTSKDLAPPQKPNKLGAKKITISVSHELRRDINKLNLSVSKICQQALKEAVNKELKNWLTIKEEKNMNVKAGDAAIKRLMKQIGEPIKTSISDFMDECYEAGQTWASNEASIEELKDSFEGDGVGDMQLIFGNECSMVPSKTLEKDEDNELFFSFYDGARNMWIEIKNVLEAKGYEF